MTKSNRRALRWLLYGLVVVGIVALFALLKLRGPQVELATVTRRDIVQTVVASGRIMPPVEVNIGSLLSSTVSELVAREGDEVQAGQLLLRLDDAAYLAQVRQAEAALAEAQAGRRSLVALDAPTARQQLAQAQARLKRETKAAERTARLRASGAVTQEESELSETNLALAQSQVRAAQLQVGAVSQGGSGAARAAASLALAQAQLERAKVELMRTQIRAPIAGVVLSRFVEPGDLVSPGAKLFVISGVGDARVVIEPDERSLSQIKLGQVAKVSTEAFPNDSFEAKVSYIAPSVNAKRGTIEVRLNVPRAPEYLKPDMTVSTEITVGRVEQAIVVPVSAVRGTGQPSWVFIVQQGRVHRRNVALGVRGDTTVQIAEGLRDGDVIVVDSVAPLQDGQRVRPTPSQAP